MDSIRYKYLTPKLTNKQLICILNELDFDYIIVNKGNTHKASIYFFKKLLIEGKIIRNIFISKDLDAHTGGTWKAAFKARYLINNKKRLGTFNYNFSDRISD